MTTIVPSIRSLDNLFENFWRSSLPVPAGQEGDGLSLRPRVDIFEGEKAYRIEAELPGVRKEDVNINVEGNTLTLSAERQKREGTEPPFHSERYSEHRFLRSFTLGKDVETDSIEASMADGVLTLVVPKQEASLPRRIQVK